ncbi:hypothetical protein [Micromonospora sp. LOL_021]|uniref:hypothetical protein n=1 Tax=Micromonospora sp. LOL_021 TaxID=3345417 RepID=UPI003A896872
MRLFVLRKISVVGAVALAMAGCSQSAKQPADTPRFAQYEPEEPGAGDSALLKGSAVVVDGCLAVEDASSGTTYTPIFPVPGSEPASIRAGDELTLRGGAAERPPAGAQVPDQCPSSGPFWLVVAAD